MYRVSQQAKNISKSQIVKAVQIILQFNEFFDKQLQNSNFAEL